LGVSQELAYEEQIKGKVLVIVAKTALFFKTSQRQALSAYFAECQHRRKKYLTLRPDAVCTKLFSSSLTWTQNQQGYFLLARFFWLLGINQVYY
jgi:hypothetical protein